jgi:PAS domain S-box-containing protein
VTDLSSEELWQRTLQSIHDGAVDAIITIDERGTMETVNPATEALFGYSSAELIGKNVKMLMPDPYRAEHDGYLRKYHDTGDRKVIGVGREVVAQTKDGRMFPIHLAVSEVKVGEQRKYAGFVRDLSNLKLVQEQEAALGRIIEESLNEVFIFDAETLHFIQVNHGARENLGYSLEELQQLSPVDIKPDFDDQQFRETIRPLLSGELDKLSFKTIHERKDGSTYHVEISLQLSTFQGTAVFVATILDVSQRIEAEQKVQRQQDAMQAELKQLVETRTAQLRATQADPQSAQRGQNLSLLFAQREKPNGREDSRTP